jgi:hypothetical protein
MIMRFSFLRSTLLPYVTARNAARRPALCLRIASALEARARFHMNHYTEIRIDAQWDFPAQALAFSLTPLCVQ